MIRNVKQMMDEMDQVIDRVRSARFQDSMRVLALNIAQDKILDDRYDNIKQRKVYSFQAIQRIKDELRTLVTKDFSISPSGDVIAYPANYKYLVELKVVIDGSLVLCQPLDYDSEGDIQLNPFRRPTPSEPLYIDSDQGITVYHNTGSFSSAKMSYLRIPRKMVYDATVPLTNAHTFVIGDTVYVLTGSVTYNSIVYNTGDTFTILTGLLTYTGTGTTLVIVNTEFPEPLHREIIEVAASILTGNIQDYNKKQSIEQENMRS